MVKTNIGLRHQALPLFFIVLLIVAFKSNDALTLPQFWAEDATVFFREQFGHSLPQLFAPYAGYLHVIPRLVAWLASLFPATKAPLIYNLSAIILTATAISFTIGRLRTLIPTALVLIVFAAVPTSGEIFGTITNIQWFLQFVLAATCFTPAAKLNNHGRWLRDIAYLAISLTGPFSIIVILVVFTVASLSWLDRKFDIGSLDGGLAQWSGQRDWRTISVIALGATVQTIVLCNEPTPKNESQQGLLDLIKITFGDLVPIHIFGTNFLTENAWLLVYIAIISLLFIGRGMRGENRLVVLSFILFSAIETFAPVRLKVVTPLYHFGLGDRYFFAIKIVFWLALFAAYSAFGSNRQRDITSAIAVLIGLIAIINANHLRRPAFHDFQWKQHARELVKPGQHYIPINPTGWGMTLEGTYGRSEK